MSSPSGWRKCSCVSLWPDYGLNYDLAPLLPQWGWREPELGEQQHLQSLLPQQEFGSAPEEGIPASRGSAQEAGPSAAYNGELRASSHALQCFLMAAGEGLRPQQDAQVPSRLFMLSLDSRISPGHKSCFLLAFSWHKIYICFYYYICSSKNGMCKNSFPSVSWPFQS